MKFIPILFSTAMVQAILEGRKTMTRRIIKTDHEALEEVIPFPKGLGMEENWGKFRFTWDDGDNAIVSCPYGQPGDVLWVREGFLRNADFMSRGRMPFFYKTDNLKLKWKPSIHMPKEACRLFLKIKSIKVERLHDISKQDAIAEGIISECLKLLPKDCTVDYEKLTPPFATRYKVYTVKNGWTDNPIGSFSSLWEKINGLESLKANPWVWVIEFERIEKPESFI
jgi:hypothetical protein